MPASRNRSCAELTVGQLFVTITSIILLSLLHFAIACVQHDALDIVLWHLGGTFRQQSPTNLWKEAVACRQQSAMFKVIFIASTSSKGCLCYHNGSCLCPGSSRRSRVFERNAALSAYTLWRPIIN